MSCCDPDHVALVVNFGPLISRVADLVDVGLDGYDDPTESEVATSRGFSLCGLRLAMFCVGFRMPA